MKSSKVIDSKISKVPFTKKAKERRTSRELVLESRKEFFAKELHNQLTEKKEGKFPKVRTRAEVLTKIGATDSWRALMAKTFNEESAIPIVYGLLCHNYKPDHPLALITKYKEIVGGHIAIVIPLVSNFHWLMSPRSEFTTNLSGYKYTCNIETLVCDEGCHMIFYESPKSIIESLTSISSKSAVEKKLLRYYSQLKRNIEHNEENLDDIENKNTIKPEIIKESNNSLTSAHMEAIELYGRYEAEEQVNQASELTANLQRINQEIEALLKLSIDDSDLAKNYNLIREVKDSVNSLMTLKLPTQAPILYKDWKNLPENKHKKPHAITALKEIYGIYLKAGLLTQGDLSGKRSNNLDPALFIAISNYCARSNPKLSVNDFIPPSL